MCELSYKYHTSSVFYSLLQEYIEKKETLKFSSLNLFSPSRVIGQSLYSIYIGHRRCIGIYRHFYGTVRIAKDELGSIFTLNFYSLILE